MLAEFLRTRFCSAIALSLLMAIGVPSVAGQSSQVEIEWRLFNEILIIGIVVGIVVFGLLFYAIIRYREKPSQSGEKR